MSKKILGIGNAIVDIFVKVNDDFLSKNKLIKGSMKLIERTEYENLKKIIKIEKIEAGGSVANTMAGIAYLKGKFSYIEKNEELPTGASVIFVTPDSERTMCTYLGISSQLSKKDINENNINNCKIVFLEGYLWDKGVSEEMFKHVIYLSKKNNIKIAMSLSDIFCVKRHKKDFLKLLIEDLDILIGNENEINELISQKNLINSINQLKELNKLIIITRSDKGSLALHNNQVVSCDSIKPQKILDLTGAGDLFASGFFKEYVDNSNIKKCLEAGSILAAKVIEKFGARLN